MQKLISSLFLVILMISCNDKKFDQNDANTGLVTKGEGISADNVKIIIDETEDNRNEFVFGEHIVFKFSDIQGLIIEDNQVFPGMEMLVLNQETSDTMLYSPDLLSNYPVAYEKGKEVTLQASLSPAFPYTNNEQYKVKLHIWDKKGSGTMDLSMPFTLGNDEISVESNHLNYNKAYFFKPSEERVSVDRQFEPFEQVYLMIEGVEHFFVEDGLIYPALSLQATDSENQVLISEENILRSITENGINPARLFNEIPISLAFSGDIKNPVQVEAFLSDTKSDAYLKVNAEITVVENE